MAVLLTFHASCPQLTTATGGAEAPHTFESVSRSYNLRVLLPRSTSDTSSVLCIPTCVYLPDRNSVSRPIQSSTQMHYAS